MRRADHWTGSGTLGGPRTAAAEPWVLQHIVISPVVYSGFRSQSITSTNSWPGPMLSGSRARERSTGSTEKHRLNNQNKIDRIKMNGNLEKKNAISVSVKIAYRHSRLQKTR